MSKPVVLITGANGEIGRSLLERLHREGRYRVVTVDLTPLPEALRPLCQETYAGNILDHYLLNQIAAHHEIEVVFHLAALLSTRGERDPELAHQINVEGTLHLLRMAQNQSGRLGRAVRFIFPSSIAVYGLPSVEEKRATGRVREEQWNLPITMYGCNKLYCEHLGRYFTNHSRQLGALSSAARLDFRALRFPGLISAETVPTGGTSDYGPEMLHAAAQGHRYASFVGPDATLPFMAMPDATEALLRLLEADRLALRDTVYNVGAFSISARQIAERAQAAFPGAEIAYEPDAVRSRIVDSWPADVDDSSARQDWGWAPAYGVERAFDEYLIPNIRKRYERLEQPPLVPSRGGACRRDRGLPLLPRALWRLWSLVLRARGSRSWTLWQLWSCVLRARGSRSWGLWRIFALFIRARGSRRPSRSCAARGPWVPQSRPPGGPLASPSPPRFKGVRVFRIGA